MPFYTKLQGESLEVQKQVVNELMKRATQSLRLGEDGLTKRGLLPEDLGLTGAWAFDITSTLGYDTMVDAATISDQRFIAITGIQYAKSSEQLIKQIKIEKANKTARIWNIQGTNLLEENTIYFPDPIIVEQNQPITIYGYNDSTSTSSSSERIVIIGEVIEKKGILLAD